MKMVTRYNRPDRPIMPQKRKNVKNIYREISCGVLKYVSESKAAYIKSLKDLNTEL